LADLANLHLIVTNSGEAPVALKMDVQYPDSGQLRLGSAAIPDTSWVALSQDYLIWSQVARRSRTYRSAIPHDVELLGKKYQFNVWSIPFRAKAGGCHSHTA